MKRSGLLILIVLVISSLILTWRILEKPLSSVYKLTTNVKTKEPRKPSTGKGVTMDFARTMRSISDFMLEANQLVMNNTERQLYNRLIQVFTDICDGHNLTYSLYGGSLIGSLRHHGFVPWDDDMDLLLQDRVKPYLERLIGSTEVQKLAPLVLDKQLGKLWKVYLNVSDSKQAGNWSFKWPSIDLFFYTTVGKGRIMNHLYGSDPTADYFPLVRRPFEKMMLSTPRCGQKLVPKNFRLNCCTGNYNHRNEHGMPTVCTQCRYLKNAFAFVEEQRLSNGIVREELVLHKEILSTFTSHPCM